MCPVVFDIGLPLPQKLAVTRTAPCGSGSPPWLSPAHCTFASTPPPLKVITTTIDGILAAAGSVVSRGVAVQLIASRIAPSTASSICSAGAA
jgi:hypothetical protein